MVVYVFTNVIQVIMFPTCTYALLCVSCTSQSGHGVGRVNGVEEDGFELAEEKTKQKRQLKYK